MHSTFEDPKRMQKTDRETKTMKKHKVESNKKKSLYWNANQLIFSLHANQEMGSELSK